MPANYNKKFTDAFRDYTDYYVLIGGTATSIILDMNGLKSRTTKDYDMVLIDDRRDKVFYDVLIKFLEDGGYTPSILDENKQLYRFVTQREGYPKMIELFSTEPYWPLIGDGRITPMTFEEGLSLSALLLDKNYYELLISGKEVVEGYSVLNNKTLIIFKAKAWLDLTHRRKASEQVDSRDIKKHLNDIARLVGSLTDTEKLLIPEIIQDDMQDFLEILEQDIDVIPTNDAIILTKQEIFDALQSLLK